MRESPRPLLALCFVLGTLEMLFHHSSLFFHLKQFPPGNDSEAPAQRLLWKPLVHEADRNERKICSRLMGCPEVGIRTFAPFRSPLRPIRLGKIHRVMKAIRSVVVGTTRCFGSGILGLHLLHARPRKAINQLKPTEHLFAFSLH